MKLFFGSEIQLADEKYTTDTFLRRLSTLLRRFSSASTYLSWTLVSYSKENFPNILALADALKKIGEKHGATGGQVALAWLLAQGNDVVPIPGTTKVKVRHPPLTDHYFMVLIENNISI